MHHPVLLEEVLEFLSPAPNENFIDCTINGGGHALAILEKTAPRGRVLGIEADKNLIEQLSASVKNQEPAERLILIHDNFVNLKKIVEQNSFTPVHGILLDLGMSSEQIEKSGRGFSFTRDEPLDMRFDIIHNHLTAAEIINQWPEGDLIKIFQDYGGERYSRRIARKIKEERKKKRLITTSQLVEIIQQVVPKRFYYKTHPATRVFQALRITVNNELDNLEKTLPQILEVLVSNGRAAIISFHSLEDKIVKHFIKKNLGGITLLTKKPVAPTQEEVRQNRRSRSAKLRALIKK